MINDGGQAFPVPGDDDSYGTDGMSLRDYFAGQALVSVVKLDLTPNEVATTCYEIAAAMLEERQKP